MSAEAGLPTIEHQAQHLAHKNGHTEIAALAASLKAVAKGEKVGYHLFVGNSGNYIYPVFFDKDDPTQDEQLAAARRALASAIEHEEADVVSQRIEAEEAHDIAFELERGMM